MTYFVDDEKPSERTLDLPAGGRVALRANDVISKRTFTAHFRSDQDIVVERTLYFSGWSGFTTVGTGVARPG